MRVTYDLPNPFMRLSMGTRSRQPMVTDSRSVAAEWGSFPLDADGDTKRLSMLEADGQTGGSGAPTFMQVSDAGIPVSDREAAALEPDEPARTCGGAAAEPVGYPCCVDCGDREPCDEHCPVATVRPGKITADDVSWAEQEIAKFEPDWAALESEIEPVPAFLTDNRAEQIEELLKIARAEDWPAPRRMVG